MTTTLTDIASQIVASLRTTDPDLDTSVGTTTRKIIDAVSEQIAEAYIDQQLITYQYDIDSKVDADLDDFVQLFGMARLPAKRASGVAVFSRTSGVSTSIAIPVNTTIQSNTTPVVSVQTVSGAFMEIGAITVSVPVMAVESGPAGNLSAGTLNTITTTLTGITGVTNISPLSGGTEQETDAQLRDRWKRTVFRSLAGTEQMYLGVALDDASCYVANAIGASKRRREQVQIVSGVGQTTVDDARVTYASPVFVGANVDGGDINAKDHDYLWNVSVNPPRVEVLDATKMPDGAIFDVDFEYEPTSSRNDVDNGITNRVDIWVGGYRALTATQVVIFRQAVRFTNTSTDELYRQNFRRLDDTPPDNNNIFVPLAYGPILTVPSSITIGGVIYGLASADHPMGTTTTVGTDTIKYAYRIVHQDTAFGYTTTSLFGLEWLPTAGYLPANNSVFNIGGDVDGDYTFNSMISDIQLNVDRWRLLGVDAKVHQAKQIGLRLNLAIVYVAGSNIDAVNTAIDQAVQALLSTSGFQSRVQVSDLLQTVHNVPGVDNVRFLHDTDYTGYNPLNPNVYAVGIQRVVEGAVTASYVDGTGRPTDLRFGDNELPVLDSITKVQKAENSFGMP